MTVSVPSDTLGQYGDSDFLAAVEGKVPEDAWKVMDRLTTALQLANLRLYAAFLEQMRQLKKEGRISRPLFFLLALVLSKTEPAKGVEKMLTVFSASQ